MLDSSILTDILGALVNASSKGFPLIHHYAESLFFKLIIIEMVLFGIAIAMNRVEFKSAVVGKILAIGFTQFLIYRYVWLVDNLRDGFVKAGLGAAGNSLSVPQFLDPSSYISLGFDKVFWLLEGRFSVGSWHFLPTSSILGFFSLLVLIIMFAAFIIMGFQIFFTVVEFYLVTSLAIIFLPFLILEKTSFLGFRAVNGVLNNCIKLMVLAFIAGLSVPILQELSFSGAEPTLREGVSLTIGALAVAILMWRAPAIAMSLISGGSGLDANSSVLQPAMSALNGMMFSNRLVGQAAQSTMGAARSVGQAVKTGVKNVKSFVAKPSK